MSRMETAEAPPWWFKAENVDSILQQLIRKKPLMSSKGLIDCPDCPGKLLWVKDYQGYLYARCWECHRKTS